MPLNPTSCRFEPSADPSGRDDVAFSAPWEAQIFALVVALHENGMFTWPEWADSLGRALRRKRTLGDSPDDASPYCPWIVALESLLRDKSLASPGMLAILKELWADAARQTPHGQPVTLGAADYPSVK